MNILLVGFEEFPTQALEIEMLVAETGHRLVGAESLNEADVLIIPHHLDALFPPATPWIAVWIKGANARFAALRGGSLKNSPREILAGWDPELLFYNQRGAFFDALNQIENEL